MRYEQVGLTRQARKTIEAIKTTENVPTKSVNRLLECLGFTRTQTGSHQIWRHPKGHRVNLVYRQKDEGIWGRELKQVREMLVELEAKTGPVEQRGGKSEMAMVHEKSREKLTGSEVQAWKDSQVLMEKNLPKVNKIDLKDYETRNILKTTSDAYNELSLYVQKLGSMLQSTQEYLIELGVKIDTVANRPINTTFQPKVKLTPEERKLRLKEGAENSRAARKQKTIAKIKEAQKTHPQFAKNPTVIAAILKMTPSAVEKYYKEGLV